MKIIWGILSALALGLAAGCFSIHRAPLADGSGEHVVVHNSGWYLFNVLPICGNCSENPSCPIVMFRDDVEADDLHRRIDAYAARTGKRWEHLELAKYDRVMLTLPLSYISLPIPYLLTYRECEISGVLK